MLVQLSDLKGAIVSSCDNEMMGEVKDFYFDDETWTVRYLIIRSGDKDVIISPFSFRSIDINRKEIKTNLTLKKIQQAPDKDLVRPISKLEEEKLANYYGWPMYWAFAGVAAGVYPPEAVSSPSSPELNQYYQNKYQDLERRIQASSLRSFEEIVGYRIDTGTEKFGQIDDLLVEEDNFMIRYAVVDTVRFFPSKHVLVSSQWIDDVLWNERVFKTSLSKQAIKSSPGFDNVSRIDRTAEKKVV